MALLVTIGCFRFTDARGCGSECGRSGERGFSRGSRNARSSSGESSPQKSTKPKSLNPLNMLRWVFFFV